MTEPGLGVPEGAELLGRIAAFIVRFVVLPENVAPLLATWVVHTHAFAAANHTPYVVIRSATMRCGKSQLLEALALLVARPLPAANVTSAALYRAVTQGTEPTMLLDEQDGIRDDDIRRVLNAGFRRDQKVLRTSRDGGVEEFPAFCPKAIASIGTVAPTVADRSLHVKMVRKLPTEKVERFLQHEIEPEAKALREESQAFAEHYLSELFAARPSFPDNLDDRGCDFYMPLFAIADVAGGTWPTDVRAAAVANRQKRFDTREDPPTELLRDIHDLLEGQRGDFVFSEGLVYQLTSDPHLRWSEWHRGRGLTQAGLAKILANFGIYPGRKQVMHRHARGYFRRDLEPAFERYLSSTEPLRSAEGVDEVPLADRPDPVEMFTTRRQREEKTKLTDNPFLQRENDGN
jgi:putative DNA primase/helicase